MIHNYYFIIILNNTEYNEKNHANVTNKSYRKWEEENNAYFVPSVIFLTFLDEYLLDPLSYLLYKKGKHE